MRAQPTPNPRPQRARGHRPGFGSGLRRGLRSGLASLGTAAVLVLLAAAPARADLLGPENAEALASKLQSAAEQQDVCYGWDVTLHDNWQAYDTIQETGSNLGVGMDPRKNRQCPKWVVFEATITWTSSSSESEDSGTFDVEANIPGAPTVSDLMAIGVTEEDLVGDHDVRTIFNAVAALPQLVAENSNQIDSPTVSPSPEPTGQPADAGRIAGSGGSDFLRSNGALLGWAIGALVVGAGWLFYVLVYQPRKQAANPRPTSYWQS